MSSLAVRLGPFALVLLLAACGDDTPNKTSSSGDGGSSEGGNGTGATTSSNGGSGGEGPVCEAPEPANPDEMAQIGTIMAHFIDQDGNEAQGVDVTVCGSNLCSDTGSSDANGDVTLDAAMNDYVDPRFSSGYFGQEHTKLSAAIPTKPDHDFGTLRVIALPAFSAGVPLTAGEDATQGGAVLSVPAGAEIDFDITVSEPTEQVFRAAVVDISTFTAAELPAVDASLNLEVIVALGPNATHICPGAGLSFDNVASWAADADVEIYIHGTKTFDHYAVYGGWAKIGDATVSSDGNTVTMNDGAIEVLGTFGARLKP